MFSMDIVNLSWTPSINPLMGRCEFFSAMLRNQHFFPLRVSVIVIFGFPILFDKILTSFSWLDFFFYSGIRSGWFLPLQIICAQTSSLPRMDNSSLLPVPSHHRLSRTKSSHAFHASKLVTKIELLWVLLLPSLIIKKSVDTLSLQTHFIWTSWFPPTSSPPIWGAIKTTFNQSSNFPTVS